MLHRSRIGGNTSTRFNFSDVHSVFNAKCRAGYIQRRNWLNIYGDKSAIYRGIRIWLTTAGRTTPHHRQIRGAVFRARQGHRKPEDRPRTAQGVSPALLKHAFEGKLTAQWRAENQDKLETADALLKRIQQERAQRYQQQLAAGKPLAAAANLKPPKPLPPLTAEELAGIA